LKIAAITMKITKIRQNMKEIQGLEVKRVSVQ
jgi:hypothetical protein